MSTSLLLGVVGAGVGFLAGGPVGAQIGFLAGSLIGNLIDPPKLEGPRLGDLKLQVSTYGKMIPYVWGTGRMAGNVTDQTNLTEHSQTSSGKGGPETTNYTYSASFDIMLCKRLPGRTSAILGITKIWADARLIWSTTSGGIMPCTVYLGDSTQVIDPTFEAIHGVGNVPAYYGYAHVVFADYYLTEFGNRIPALEFEVYTSAGVYPWRVSSFSPWDIVVDPYFSDWNAEYLDGVITVMSTSARVPTAVIRTQQFDINGVQIGTTVTQTMGGFASLNNAIRNTNSTQLYFNDAGGSRVFWFTRDPITGILVQGVESSPDSLAIPSQTTGNANISMGGYTYVASGNVGLTTIARYIEGGGFTGTFYYLDVNYGPSNVALGDSDTGHLYVIAEEAGPIIKMWKFNPDLTLVKFWANSEITGTFLRANGNFYVYKNQICIEWKQNVVGIPSLIRLVTIGAGNVLSDHATTLARSTSYSFVINLYGGLMLDGNGVFSLDPPPLAAILSDIVGDLSNLTPAAGQYDVTELTDTVRWFAIGSQMTVRNALDTLRKVFFFDAVESDDIVKFRKRGSASIATILDEDLGARAYGNAPEDLLKTIRRREQDLPRTVSLNFIDVNADYQPGVQSSPRQVTLSQQDVTLQVPVGFTNTEALQKCHTIQTAEWMERESFEWRTTRKWAHLEPCDVITVRGRILRIRKRVEEPDGKISWEGVLSAPSLYTQSATGATGGFTPQVPLLGGASLPTLALLFDVPMVDDLDFEHGFYVAMGPSTVGSWPGGTLYRSVDGGTTYQAVVSVLTANTIGIATTQLQDFDGGYVFDESSVVTVLLTSGSLSSATGLSVLNGTNMAILGVEIFQFKTATLIATDTYTLSGLLRGRRGTEYAIPGHATGERFALLPLTNVDTPIGNLFQTALYKAVTIGGTIASAIAVPFANMGAAARPYAPVEVGGGPNGSGDLVIEWTRRTRIGGAWNDFSDVPIGETTTEYIVQIWDANYLLCARTIPGITSETTTYTLAQAVTDFGAAQSFYYITVGQKGAFELGTQTRAVLPGTGGSVSAVLVPITPYNGSPTPPPGGTGGIVNQTISSYPSGSVITAGVVVGDTYVVRFNVSASPVLTSVSVAEYTDPATYRTVILSTDVNGNNIIATFYGNTATYIFTPLASTAYYVIIRVLLPDGSTGRPLGEGADLICSIGAA